MGTIVDAVIPTEQFALADTFQVAPDAEFETVRVVAHESGHVMPYLWASAADMEALDASLAADSSTEEVERLTTDEERALYRIHWQADISVVVHVFVEEHGTLLSAHGERDHWELRVLFPDHDAVSATFDFCQDLGIDLSIRRVNGVGDLVDHGGVELSDEQYEALIAAFQTDYYGVPRGKTLEDLAATLEVSHQALSERLRRGHRNLVATTLCNSPTAAEREP